MAHELLRVAGARIGESFAYMFNANDTGTFANAAVVTVFNANLPDDLELIDCYAIFGAAAPTGTGTLTIKDGSGTTIGVLTTTGVLSGAKATAFASISLTANKLSKGATVTVTSAASTGNAFNQCELFLVFRVNRQ